MPRTCPLLGGAAAPAAFCLALVLSGCADPLVGSTSPGVIPAELPKDENELKRRIDDARAFTQRRYMNTTDHAAWQIIHGILAFQRKLEIYHDNQRVQALEWLLGGGQLRGFTLLPRENGRLDSVLEAGSRTGQGHDNQWLGYLDACGLRADDTIIWQGQKYTIRGMVEQAKLDMRDGTEDSWTLMGLSGFAEREFDPRSETQLVPFDKEWEAPRKDAYGNEVNGPDGKPIMDKWSLERIIAYEARQDLNASACGGTHRLVGITLTLNRYRDWYRKTHGGSAPQLQGGWRTADEVVRSAVETFRQTQQPDGAFSAAYLSRPSTSADAEVRMRTTGHAFEFLSWTVDQEELKSEWMVRAAVHLCELFEKTRNMPIDCGALYHAARSLQVYRERRWGKE
jgi:hypothetical protein